ncbi:MAG: class I SAM-dependent methyltransferase [bacterium]|nr:class I SAM-dependent methyltransferase [bacterium]
MEEKKIYNTWLQRWKGVDKGDKMTFLAKYMFKAKRKVLEKVLGEIDTGTIIEVGCGLGHTMEIFRDAGLDYIGIDLSPEAVAFCKKKGLKVIQKRLEEVEEQYHIVSSDGMLEHFLNFEPYAKYMMDISEKYVMLIQPNYDSFNGKTLAYLGNILRGHVNVYEYNYRLIDFINVFEKNGFEISASYPIFFNVFRLILFKKGEALHRQPGAFH